MELSKKNTFRILGIITFSIALLAISQRLELVGTVISKTLEIFAPVIVGVSLAFILNIPMRILETKVFVFLKKSKFKFLNKMLRPISLITTLVLATGFVAALLFIIVPQLADAIMMLIDKIPTYYENVVVWIEKMVTRFNLNVHTEFLHNPRFDFAKISSFVGKFLPDNSTDEIAQLVDRCGRGGYRVELYRQLMKLHSTLDPVERRQKAVFRKMMVLNTARVQVIAPELVDGGESQYVKDLCSYFMKT